jgi:hypothetical protein
MFGPIDGLPVILLMPDLPITLKSMKRTVTLSVVLGIALASVWKQAMRFSNHDCYRGCAL